MWDASWFTWKTNAQARIERAVVDPSAALAMMDQLHDRGVHLSMDDFGARYSSLSYLKRFQIYKLKIDQSFVRDLDDDPYDDLRAILTEVSGVRHAAMSPAFGTPGDRNGDGVFLGDTALLDLAAAAADDPT